MNKSFEFPRSHPAVHQMSGVIDQRLRSICSIFGVTRHQELFSFSRDTELRPEGDEGVRVRPLYFGDAQHFFSDPLFAAIAMLQVEMHRDSEPEPKIVTYAVCSEAPMVIVEGDTLDMENWNDFVSIAIADATEYDSYADLLPNILFELSNSSVLGGAVSVSVGSSSTTIDVAGTPLY